jgi:hypothetical protein
MEHQDYEMVHWDFGASRLTRMLPFGLLHVVSRRLSYPYLPKLFVTIALPAVPSNVDLVLNMGDAADRPH